MAEYRWPFMCPLARLIFAGDNPGESRIRSCFPGFLEAASLQKVAAGLVPAQLRRPSGLSARSLAMATALCRVPPTIQPTLFSSPT
jgi:hypothetical protein